MKVGIDNIVALLIGVGQPARNLVLQIILILGQEGEMVRGHIPWLNLCHRVIDTLGIDPRRCTRFETADFQTQFFQIISQLDGSQTIIRA